MSFADRKWIALEAGLLFLLAAAIRGAGIGQEPAGDELYQLLAARHYLEDGTLELVDGGRPYTRGSGYTLLVSMLLRTLGGESLVAARLPAWIAGSLVPVVLFLWLRGRGDRAGAWIAGLLMALAPVSIGLAQEVRFYSAQQLGFLLGAIGVHALVEGPRSPGRFLILGGGSAAALVLALYLQVITVVGLAGLGLYVLLVTGPDVLRWLRQRYWRGGALLAVAVAAIALGAWLIRRQLGRGPIEMFSYVDLWAQGNAQAWRFYHWILLERYPTLWTVYPALVVLAIYARPSISLLSACVFGTGIVAHSLLAWKAPRYFDYLMPFYFVIGGLGLAQLGRSTAHALRQVAERFAPARLEIWAVPALSGLVLAATALSVFAGNRAFLDTLDLVTRDPTFSHPGMIGGSISWARASEQLRPLAEKAEAVVSANDLHSIYFLGRLDYVLNRDHLYRGEERPQFTLDPQLRAPIVSEPAAIAAIIDCHATGLIVAQTWSMASDFAVPPDTAKYIREHTQKIPLPAEWGIEAYRWERPTVRSEGCPPEAAVPQGTHREPPSL